MSFLKWYQNQNNELTSHVQCLCFRGFIDSFKKTVKFEFANFSDCDFSFSEFKNLTFGPNCFEKANLVNCIFTNIKASGSCFDGAQLSFSEFQDCTFKDLTCTTLNLNYCNFIHCKFERTSPNLHCLVVKDDFYMKLTPGGSFDEDTKNSLSKGCAVYNDRLNSEKKQPFATLYLDMTRQRDIEQNATEFQTNRNTALNTEANASEVEPPLPTYEESEINKKNVEKDAGISACISTRCIIVVIYVFSLPIIPFTMLIGHWCHFYYL